MSEETEMDGELDEAVLSKISGGGDTLSELSQEQQLKFQTAMDRQSKASTTLSNILKKSSDTSQSIIQNMK